MSAKKLPRRRIPNVAFAFPILQIRKFCNSLYKLFISPLRLSKYRVFHVYQHSGSAALSMNIFNHISKMIDYFNNFI